MANDLSKLGTQLKTLYSTQGAVEDECANADLVIGGVLIPGAAAPKLVTRKMLKDWKPGSVLVDVAIDQGGCAETSRATTHDNPTYVVDGVIHYCVANMPGGVARTSTFALNNVTLPFALKIAENGTVALVTKKLSAGPVGPVGPSSSPHAAVRITNRSRLRLMSSFLEPSFGVQSSASSVDGWPATSSP